MGLQRGRPAPDRITLSSMVGAVDVARSGGLGPGVVLPVDEVMCNNAAPELPGGYGPNLVHCPSETTSTEPSTTLIAVCSSMA